MKKILALVLLLFASPLWAATSTIPNLTTVTDPDGKTRTAYGYDWRNIPRLDQTEIEKALPPKTVEDLKAAPLKIGIERITGYNNMDKAAYEAKFNTVEEEKP